MKIQHHHLGRVDDHETLSTVHICCGKENQRYFAARNRMKTLRESIRRTEQSIGVAYTSTVKTVGGAIKYSNSRVINPAYTPRY